MKIKINEIAKKAITDLEEKKITRKQAIKKTALIAVSAATMMMFLGNNAKGSTTSPGVAPTGNGWN